MKINLLNIKSKKILSIFFLSITVLGYCFEFRDNQIYIDVLVLHESSFSMFTEDAEIQELDSPFREEISGTKVINLENYFSEVCYFLKSDNYFESAENHFEENLKWVDNRLISHEKQSFVSEYFDTKQEAIQYKNENNILADEYSKNQTISEIEIDGKFYSLPCFIKGELSVKLNAEYQYFKNGIFIYSQNNELLVVARLALNEYLYGVVGNEIGNNVPLEAQKAQAVAARTKAVKTIIHDYAKNEFYDLDSSTKFQVYKGNKIHNKRIKKAVDETKGEIITYQNEIIDAVFSSCCGGKTENNSNIWQGKQMPYLKSIADGKRINVDLTKEYNAKNWIKKKTGANCSFHKNGKEWEKKIFNWKKSISNKKIAASVGLGKIKGIKILKRGESGRILKMKLIGNSGSKIIENQTKIRQIFSNSRSSLFYIKKIGDEIIIEGKGSGHGVGMCQMGMLNQIRSGKKYKSVLKFYYPKTKIHKIRFLKN